MLLLLNNACKKSGIKEEIKPIIKDPVPIIVVQDSIQKSVYDLSLLQKCTEFNNIPVVSILQNQSYSELSGIAESRKNAGILYVHEDKTGKNIIYLINKKGDDLGKVILDGCTPRDWEDMVVGPGPDSSKSYVYVADIGDNNARYTSIIIYRFPEPDLSAVSASAEIHVKDFDKIQVSYSKGPANAETLLIDPLTRDLFIATKENSKTYIYSIPYPQSTISIIKVKPLAQLNLDFLTSGDISANGKEILLRNKSQIWYWKRNDMESVVSALLRKPQDAPYAANEHQGEAICFAADGSGYYTNSETRDYPGAVSAISFYKRIK